MFIAEISADDQIFFYLFLASEHAAHAAPSSEKQFPIDLHEAFRQVFRDRFLKLFSTASIVAA